MPVPPIPRPGSPPRRRLTALLLALLALPGTLVGRPGRAAPAAGLSLEQVLAEGLAVSPQLQRAERLIARDRAITTLNRRLLLPRLDLIGSASYTQVGTSFGLVTGLPTLGDISLTLRQDGYAVLRNSFANAGLVLDVNLLPLQPLAQVAAASARQQGSEASLRESKRRTRFELISAYRQLQLSQALVPVWRAALSASTALSGDVEAFRRRGLAARIDGQRARALEATDRQGLADAEAQRAALQGRLAILLQRPAGSLVEAADPIVEQPPWPLPLEATLQRALQGRPLLEALRFQQLAQRREARGARAALYPSLGLVGGVGISGDRLAVPVLRQGGRLQGPVNAPLPGLSSSGSGSGSFYNWGAALLLRQPLYDGGRSAEAATLAEREADLLVSDERLARQQISQEVTTAWQGLEASPAAIAAARQVVQAQETALRDARLRYRAQVDPLTEVLLVQRDLQAARASLLGALTRQAIDRAVLERETGG
ncbi:MAG: TolC family protein [Cyanobacteriota bacterium]|nr:TolC family protein [Cyanobacteriota bacterium]